MYVNNGKFLLSILNALVWGFFFVRNVFRYFQTKDNHLMILLTLFLLILAIVYVWKLFSEK
jgi:hypothetical protein